MIIANRWRTVSTARNERQHGEQAEADRAGFSGGVDLMYTAPMYVGSNQQGMDIVPDSKPPSNRPWLAQHVLLLPHPIPSTAYEV